MPGWEQDAWGYHGDDGGMFHKWWMTREFSKNDTYGTGQVIGCYIDTVHGTARFTKDGKLQKHTFHGLKGRLYPMVGLHSQGAEIQVNFGPDGFKHRDEITGEL
ncbi:hypothetical protein GQ53DRAFT_742501 [Thozetella sp. PMI_491]|nr:hypothetical protein GQ53DRAFT_742501 [Thozetella sp. PMI_491]